MCGHKLPDNLLESAEVRGALFTPSTKADVGHDENISEDRVRELLGADPANYLREILCGFITSAQLWLVAVDNHRTIQSLNLGAVKRPNNSG